MSSRRGYTKTEIGGGLPMSGYVNHPCKESPEKLRPRDIDYRKNNPVSTSERGSRSSRPIRALWEGAPREEDRACYAVVEAVRTAGSREARQIAQNDVRNFSCNFLGQRSFMLDSSRCGYRDCLGEIICLPYRVQCQLSAASIA